MNNAILIQQAYPGLGFDKILELTRQHHKAYCQTWELDYQCVTDNVFEHDPVLGSWAKIKLIQDALAAGYWEVIWLDADTLITDINADLRNGIARGHIGACWQRIPQLDHWNVGALYISSTDATRKFIDEWLAAYPSPNNWNEQGVFNRLAMQSKTVVTISDKWNGTAQVSEVPDAVVLGFHGQGNAKYRYELMQATFDKLFPAEIAIPEDKTHDELLRPLHW